MTPEVESTWTKWNWIHFIKYIKNVFVQTNSNANKKKLKWGWRTEWASLYLRTEHLTSKIHVEQANTENWLSIFHFIFANKKLIICFYVKNDFTIYYEMSQHQQSILIFAILPKRTHLNGSAVIFWFIVQFAITNS